MKLPSPIAAYVEAANRRDAERVAACFTPEGAVRDEGTVRRGSAAIADWARETATRYASTIEPVAIAGEGPRCKLTANVSGNFPGSPATLQFDFVLQAAGIASLEITA